MKRFLPKNLTKTQTFILIVNLLLLVYIIQPNPVVEKTCNTKMVEFECTQFRPVDSGSNEEQIRPVTMSMTPKLQIGNSKVTVKKKNTKSIPITNVIKDPMVLDFICKNQFLQRSFEVQKKTGLLVSTIIAQKGIESNWGKSSLTKKTKNLSNIKCNRKECKKHNIKLKKRKQMGSVTNHCIQLWDDSPADRFVRLDTNWEGWKQYEQLLNKRYSGVRKSKTVLGQARELKKKGWATDKNYAKTLDNTAKKFNFNELQKYINQGYTITTTNGKYILLKQ